MFSDTIVNLSNSEHALELANSFAINTILNLKLVSQNICSNTVNTAIYHSLNCITFQMLLLWSMIPFFSLANAIIEMDSYVLFRYYCNCENFGTTATVRTLAIH